MFCVAISTVFWSLLVFSNNNVGFVNAQVDGCGDPRCVSSGTNPIDVCAKRCTNVNCIVQDNFSHTCSGISTECGTQNCVRPNTDVPVGDACCRNICFSSMASADVLNKGKTLIKDLQIGDEVLTSSGMYQKVYTIDHKNADELTHFVQIYTDNNNESPLEVTNSHLLYLYNNKDPIPASDVKVGDMLQTINKPATVTKISSVKRNGLWNPITEDGTIVVDGIVSSTYSTTAATGFTDATETHVEIGGMKLMSTHDFIHILMAPYRAFCMTFTSSFCDINENDGRNVYSKVGFAIQDFATKQHPIVQNGMMLVALVSFSFIYLIIMNPLVSGVSILTAFYSIANYYNRNNKNIKKDL